MSQSTLQDFGGADARWKTLYQIGGYTAAALVVIVVLAIIAFIIWPYAPGEQSTEAIFTMIQNDPLGGLMALDFFVLLGGMLSVVLMIALYAALKHVNESWALVALVIGVISGAAAITGRPIVEIFAYSNLWAAASSEVEKGYYLTAGEAMLPMFHGTAWVMYLILNTLGGLIFSVLMLRSEVFSRATAYVGLVTTLVTFGFWIPVIGPALLFVPTITGAIWNAMMARRFFQLSAGSTAAQPGGGYIPTGA